jgi:pyruvate dehydrogenase E1 component beta subunit
MSKITYLQAVRNALSEEMRRDDDVFLIGEDIGVYGGTCGVTEGMIDEFGPERMMETPVSELAYTGIGVGAALTGSRPVVEIMFSDFVTVAYDQIVNQAAKMRFMSGGQISLPLVIRTPFGAGTGAAAQHSQCPESWFTNVPGLKIIAPSNAYDAKGLLKAAIRDDNPVIFFEHKLLYKETGEVPDEEYLLPIGKADIKRSGEDISLIAYGRMVGFCLQAAEQLSKEGISAEVVDLRTLVPLDKKCIVASVKKTGRALVVYESALTGGFGGEVAAAIAGSEAFYYLKAPVARLGASDYPIAFSREIEAQMLPDKDKIAAAVKNLLK